MPTRNQPRKKITRKDMATKAYRAMLPVLPPLRNQRRFSMAMNNTNIVFFK